MEHHFNVEIAKEYGLDVATFLQNIAFWTLKNIANKQHFIDGRYWVYNTQEAWTILFPYWSRQNIRTIVKKCIDHNLIVLGRHNKLNYDKTAWYAFTDFGLTLFPSLKIQPVDKPKSLGWNQPIDGLESTNRLVGTNQAIPDRNPYKKPDKSFSGFEDQKKIKSEMLLPPTSVMVPPPLRIQQGGEGIRGSTYLALDKWGKPIPSGYVNRDTMSKEAKEAKKGSVKEAEQAMAKLPRHLQPKRLRAGGLDSAPPVV